MKRILIALLLCTASVRAGDIFIFNSGLGALTATGIAEAVVSPYTNGAALGATALQPPATNTLAAAAAHAATAHGVTQEGGFKGGVDAQTMYGGAVGSSAYATDGGAVGSSAYATDGGAVGMNATTSDGFAGGKDAFATTDGNFGSPGIDAIQLGTGGNSEPFSLQIYSHKLMNADGTIPVERLTRISALIPALTNGATWQNPANATNWTWTSNGSEITLTGYSGTNAVVIPDMLDGLPVTGFGEVFRGNMNITSVGGGANIKAVGNSAFYGCVALNSVSLPACTAVGDDAFRACEALNSVSLPACTTVGDYAFGVCLALNSVSLPACTTVGTYAFEHCEALISVSLPACTTVGNSAFFSCEALNSVSLPACTTVGECAFRACEALNSVSLPACTTVGNGAFLDCMALISVTFGQNAPAPDVNVFANSTPTIYVSNPHATGWGDTWNGRPVVRPPLYGSIATAQAYTLNNGTIIDDGVYQNKKGFYVIPPGSTNKYWFLLEDID